MGSENRSNEVENILDLSTSSPEKLAPKGIVEPRKEILDETEEDPLRPITPDSERENGELPVDSDSSPSSAKKAKNLPAGDSDDNQSPQTPKDGVFDPFAPGPDHMALAPQCKKHVSKARCIAARRLSFDSFEAVEETGIAASVSDEEIIEAVYENLLDTILSKQLEESSNRNWDSSDCKTPPLTVRLTGIAATCPGAPMKPSGKSRNVDPMVCRRLRFSP